VPYCKVLSFSNSSTQEVGSRVQSWCTWASLQPRSRPRAWPRDQVTCDPEGHRTHTGQRFLGRHRPAYCCSPGPFETPRVTFLRPGGPPGETTSSRPNDWLVRRSSRTRRSRCDRRCGGPGNVLLPTSPSSPVFSRSGLCELLAGYREEGEAASEPRSRRPKRTPNPIRC